MPIYFGTQNTKLNGIKEAYYGNQKVYQKSIVIDNVLENNSWETIKYAIQNNLAPTTWRGQMKEIVGGDFNGYHMRYVDWTANRYTLTLGGGTKGVLLLEEITPTKYPVNTLDNNTGGYAASELRQLLNTTIKESLPEDLKSTLVQSQQLSGIGNSTTSGTSYSDNYLFIPSEYELTGSRQWSIGAAEGSPRYNYSTSVKYIKGTNTAGWWWERSPVSGMLYWCAMSPNGSPAYTNTNDAVNIGLIFAIAY